MWLQFSQHLLVGSDLNLGALIYIRMKMILHEISLIELTIDGDKNKGQQ